MGSTLASLTLRLVFGGATARDHFFGTAPAGTDVQAGGAGVRRPLLLPHVRRLQRRNRQQSGN